MHFLPEETGALKGGAWKCPPAVLPLAEEGCQQAACSLLGAEIGLSAVKQAFGAVQPQKMRKSY